MIYKFASRRQLSFIVSVGGRNLLVAFGNRNIAGVSVFMTTDEKVANAVRRHSLSRRGIIEETTPRDQTDADATSTAAKESNAFVSVVVAKTAANATGTEGAGKSEEREYDNYTVARESICKEFGIKKRDVRNPGALAKVAKEHGIIITYKKL